LVAGCEQAVAHRLGLSNSTVKHHLANARPKVGATTTAQSVWIPAPRSPEPDCGGIHGRPSLVQPPPGIEWLTTSTAVAPVAIGGARNEDRCVWRSGRRMDPERCGRQRGHRIDGA
jgi:hypothetical protein